MRISDWSSDVCSSDLPSDRFLFAGFPPPKAVARSKWLAELKPVQATLVLLESAQRLPDSLAAMAAVFGGGRAAAVTRELPKKFEEVRRGSTHERRAGTECDSTGISRGSPDHYK